MNSKLMFLSSFIKSPTEVAAIAPSSKYIIKKIKKNIDFSKTNCIVEYGPGVGTITKDLLKNLNEDSKLICFESNPDFCKFIEKNIDDPRLIIVNDVAEKIDFHLKQLNVQDIDYVISGIPFSLIKTGDKKDIVKKTGDSLKRGGKFIVYQYSRHMKKYLGEYFNKISTDFEIRGIPPTFIFACEKL
jgi:phospholipid N-methyltransferase